VRRQRPGQREVEVGQASCVLAETPGSLGSARHAGLGRVTVGIEISATHHRAASAGR
jgi:1,4-dihydroxy-2-naphthoyl-CoA hydrolase